VGREKIIFRGGVAVKNQYLFMTVATAASILSIATLGCNNHLNQKYDESENLVISDEYSSELNDASFECPGTDNILPDNDWDFNNSDSFTICTSSASRFNVLIKAHPEESFGDEMVSVFPLQYINAANIFWKIDINGLPMVKQISKKEDGIELSFENTNFNGFFIVSVENQAQMSQCLQANNSSICPNYSYGVFRSNESTGSGSPSF